MQIVVHKNLFSVLVYFEKGQADFTHRVIDNGSLPDVDIKSEIILKFLCLKYNRLTICRARIECIHRILVFGIVFSSALLRRNEKVVRQKILHKGNILKFGNAHFEIFHGAHFGIHFTVSGNETRDEYDAILFA